MKEEEPAVENSLPAVVFGINCGCKFYGRLVLRTYDC